MEFLSEEVDGALIPQKISGEPIDTPKYTPSAAAFHVLNNHDPGEKTDIRMDHFACFVMLRVQECTKVTVTNGTSLPARNAGGTSFHMQWRRNHH